jgi:hypothetical protein
MEPSEKQSEQTPDVSSQGPENIAARVQQAVREARRNRIRIWLFLALIIMSPAFVPIIMWLIGRAPLLLLLVFWFIIPALMFRSRRRKEALRSLIMTGDVRLIGPLLELRETLQFKDNMDTRGLIQATLTDLLPRLKAGDAALLTDRQHDSLCRLLREATSRPIMARDVRKLADDDLITHDPNLARAVLRALEQVGDERAVPSVRRVAEARCSSPKLEALQREARECLAALNARLERERPGKTLLRPAAAPETPAELLLRPACGAGETDADKLLRPGSPPQNGQ